MVNLQSLIQLATALRGAGNIGRNAQRLVNAFQKKQNPNIKQEAISKPTNPMKQWGQQQKKLNASANERKKLSNFAQKKNEQLNSGKNNPLPTMPKMSFNTSPKLNVGAKMNDFKKQQSKENKKIGKQLANPVANPYETKIKNIMGVN